MSRIRKLLQDIAKDPATYLQLIVMVLVVVAALYMIISSRGGVFLSEMWRDLYCQNNPLVCIQKGW